MMSFHPCERSRLTLSRSSCSVTRMMSMKSLLLTIFTSFLPLVYHEAGRRAREEVNTVKHGYGNEVIVRINVDKDDLISRLIKISDQASALHTEAHALLTALREESET